MDHQQFYRLLQPGNPDPVAWAWRGVHHAMVAAGIGVFLALTVAEWRVAYGEELAIIFFVVAGFFVFDYLLRLYIAAGAPGAAHRGALRARLAWIVSFGGLYDLMGAAPGIIALIDRREASLFGFIWVFKYVRYSPGLSILERVITNARHALLSVLLGLVIVLLAAASLMYLLEHDVAQPQDGVYAFRSIPAALWWAIVTLTTTGYGDVVPQTPAGRMLAGVVMVCGIMVFALLAGILATGYAEEMRRREFLRTWDLVARVPFFHNLGATLIAEVARLLRARDYPPHAVIMRRGEPGDCMYFIADGEVEIEVPGRPRLDAGSFFGELALLTGEPRNATVVAVQSCTLLILDIVDFFELIGRQPELARVIHDEAVLRLGPGAPMHPALKAMIARDNAPAS